MSVTERTLTVGEGGNVAFHVARPAGTRVRVVVLEDADASTLTNEERFQLAALASATPDDPEEDAIWERYLHD
jgi:hypothetical protein